MSTPAPKDQHYRDEDLCSYKIFEGLGAAGFGHRYPRWNPTPRTKVSVCDNHGAETYIFSIIVDIFDREAVAK
jgi:hypothetical protein